MTQSPPAQGLKGLEHDRLLSCPPSYQQHCWSWFEALLHSSWLTRLTLPRVSVRTGGSNCRFWPGMSPSTAGWDQAPLHWHQPGTQPSGNAGCCQGAHDHRPLTEDATRPTEKKKKHLKTFNLLDFKIHFKIIEKQMRLDTSTATLRTSHRQLSKIFIPNSRVRVVPVWYQDKLH